jgi:hypothetical protein
MFHVKHFGKVDAKIFAKPFTSSGLGRVGLGKIVVSLAADGLVKTSSPFIRAYCPIMKFGAQRLNKIWCQRCYKNLTPHDRQP